MNAASEADLPLAADAFAAEMEIEVPTQRYAPLLERSFGADVGDYQDDELDEWYLDFVLTNWSL